MPAQRPRILDVPERKISSNKGKKSVATTKEKKETPETVTANPDPITFRQAQRAIPHDWTDAKIMITDKLGHTYDVQRVSFHTDTNDNRIVMFHPDSVRPS